MAAVIEEPLISGSGTSEARWQSWPGLHALQTCTASELVPPGHRAVVVSPHPDDEVLAFGGLLAMLSAHGVDTLVVSVTDGDASHPGSARWPPQALGAQRRLESAEGLHRLGVPRSAQVCLALPDGHLVQHQHDLAQRLAGLIRPGDVVLSTWELDGHPDHEATAQATAQACKSAGGRHVQAPVWMWHWAVPGDLRVPWSRMRRVPLSAYALGRKARAIRAHATQLCTQDTGAPPVLPPSALQRLVRCFEYIILPLDD